MKRKLKWTGVVLLVLLVGLGAAFVLSPRDPITGESWKKIRIGMTEKEVETILGGPGKSLEESVAHFTALKKQMGKLPFVPDGVVLMEPGPRLVWGNQGLYFSSTKIWTGPLGRTRIDFDKEGLVGAKNFWGWRSANPTFIERLRDWIGW